VVNNLKNTVLNIINNHIRKAEQSEYDRSVSILAVSFVRDWLSSSQCNTKESIVAGIESLKDNYNDKEGQYTNGKGVIGAIIDDIRGC